MLVLVAFALALVMISTAMSFLAALQRCRRLLSVTVPEPNERLWPDIRLAIHLEVAAVKAVTLS